MSFPFAEEDGEEEEEEEVLEEDGARRARRPEDAKSAGKVGEQSKPSEHRNTANGSQRSLLIDLSNETKPAGNSWVSGGAGTSRSPVEIRFCPRGTEGLEFLGFACFAFEAFSLGTTLDVP